MEGVAKGMVVGMHDPASVTTDFRGDVMVLQFEVEVGFGKRRHTVRKSGKGLEDVRDALLSEPRLVFAEGYVHDDGLLVAERLLYK